MTETACKNIFAHTVVMRYQKIYVELLVRFSADGGMRPVEIIWEDGRKFSVDRLRKITRTPARTGSVLPVCYFCTVNGKERRLYYEEDEERWFVEVPVCG